MTKTYVMTDLKVWYELIDRVVQKDKKIERLINLSKSSGRIKRKTNCFCEKFRNFNEMNEIINYLTIQENYEDAKRYADERNEIYKELR